MISNNNSIIVAMSGGVDSSTAAALLQEKGYNIVGVTLKMHNQQKKNITDAQDVAKKLGIKHYIINYENEFQEQIIKYFIRSYVSGETPSPCIKCNKLIKFNALSKFAKQLNINSIATGHYVRNLIVNSKNELHVALDEKKDQSYFLFEIEELEKFLFPLGNITKEQTRDEAKRLKINIANKKDSQDICFLYKEKYFQYISNHLTNNISNQKGIIMHIDGYQIGVHDGIIQYTIGQRRKLNISSKDLLYVVKIDASKNIIYVGTKTHLCKSEFVVQNINWITDTYIDNVSVKIRSNHSKINAQLKYLKSNKIRVMLSEPQKAITPGQACVFYDNSRLLGGGWIMNE